MFLENEVRKLELATLKVPQYHFQDVVLFECISSALLREESGVRDIQVEDLKR